MRCEVEFSGNRTSITVDGNSDLIEVLRPAGTRFSFAYDSGHLLTARIDPMSRRTSFSYDALRRVRTVTNPDGAVYTYSYGAVHTITEPNGAVTSVQFDSDRNISAVENPLGNKTQLTWTDGWITRHEDVNGNQTNLVYTTLGNRSSRLQTVQRPTVVATLPSAAHLRRKT
ncbi:MAG: hypothetical protein O3A00_00665 [Planctomycetota bacterium]|nr:hypothetical protein [Planctomycetota bacterium]